MKLNQSEHEELTELLNLLCDQLITNEQFVRLQSLVKSDSEALKYYVEFVDLHANRVWESRWGTLDTESHKQQNHDFGELRSKLILEADSGFPMIDCPPAIKGISNSHNTNESPVSWFHYYSKPQNRGLAITVILLFVVAGLATYFAITNQRGTNPNNVDSHNTIVTNNVDDNSIEDTDNANSHGKTLVADKTLGSGPLEVRNIRLTSGTGRFVLPKIGFLIAEGPVDLEMVGPLQAKLNFGRIKVCVTEKTGYGFSVETPDGKVTDLGTEFVLNVSPGSKSSVSVLTGKVNLQVAQDLIPISETPIELLKQGDGVIFSKGGPIERIMSIVSIDDLNMSSTTEEANVTDSTIRGVSDNLQKSDTKKFYQIVPQGMKGKVLAYIDRTKYRWIGSEIDKDIPEYLKGGDYVKTFNQDKIDPNLIVKVTLNEPCELYVLFDSRLQLPDWLLNDFTRCDELIGMNSSDATAKKKRSSKSSQAGTPVDDRYTIWKRTIHAPGTVELGSNFAKGASYFGAGDVRDASMYGIVAVPLKASATKKKNEKVSMDIE